MLAERLDDIKRAFPRVLVLGARRGGMACMPWDPAPASISWSRRMMRSTS